MQRGTAGPDLALRGRHGGDHRGGAGGARRAGDRALEKVVDGRKDEREAYYEGLLEGEPDPGTAEAAPEQEPYRAGDVSAETERPVAEACEHEPASAASLPAGLEFEFSSTEQRHADALVEVAEHYLANGPGRRGRRYEVVLTIGRNELAGQLARDGAHYHVDPDWGIDEEDAARLPATRTSRSSFRMRGATCSTTNAANASSRRGCCGP